MRVTVNGQVQDFPPGMTLTSLLEYLSLQPTGVAIERNRAIVPKSLHAQTELSEGDQLEIVQFVGGG